MVIIYYEIEITVLDDECVKKKKMESVGNNNILVRR